MKFTDPIQRIDGHRYNVVIGSFSSGKTSLINFACDIDMPVGLN